MKLNRTQLAILALILTNIIWGATTPIFKWALQDIQPFTFGFFRFLISSLILLPFTYKHLRIKVQDVYTLIFLSIIGLALRVTYSYFGLMLAPSINDLIISSTAPAFIIIGAVMLFHEKPEKRVIKGTLLSFFGILVIILNPILQKGFDSTLIGNVFLLVSMALYVTYTLMLKELAPKYNPLTLLFWTFFISSIALLPFAGVEMIHNSLSGALNDKGLLVIGFSVIFPTLLAYSLNLYGIKYIKASQVGIFSYVDPFVGIAVASPLLGEHISPVFFAGAFLVFTGIYIAEKRVHYHPVHLLNPKNHLKVAAEEI